MNRLPFIYLFICTFLFVADQEGVSIQGNWVLYQTDQGYPSGYQELLITDSNMHGIIEGIIRSPMEYSTNGENSLSLKGPANPTGTETRVEFELKKDTLTLYFQYQEAVYIALKDSLSLQQLFNQEITEEKYMKAYFSRRKKFYADLKEQRE